jgi:hypothetical protein
LRRIRNGICEPIPFSEFMAWATFTGEIVRPVEYDILRKMDAEFCSITNKELEDYRLREQQRIKDENARHR